MADDEVVEAVTRSFPDTDLAPPRRGRPPSPRSREAIVSAAAEILRDSGLQGLTVDAVVARARVSKGTVYRLWGTKSEVAIDAILMILNQEIQTPNTGSAKEDFRSMMSQFAEVLRGGGLGCTYVSLLIEAQQADRISDVHARLFQQRRAVFYDVVSRGIDRGELSAGIDKNTLSDLLFGPIISRLVTGFGSTDAAMIDTVLDVVYRGVAIAAGGAGKE